ncbi:Serine carboxypeptidase F41C3.5 precursor, partial [Aphelenchoides avenae]
IDEIYDRLSLLWERDVLNTYDLYRDCQSFKWNYSSTSASMSDEGMLPPCTPDLSAYLKKAEVRSALHISESSATWTECSETIRPPLYEQTVNVRKEVSKLLASGVRVLLYYGDTDSQCNFLMAVSANEPWTFRGKLAGFKTTYAEGLTFITVRGVGHTDLPPQAHTWAEAPPAVSRTSTTMMPAERTRLRRVAEHVYQHLG